MNPTIAIGQLIQSQYQYESNVYLTNGLISKHCLILVNFLGLLTFHACFTASC